MPRPASARIRFAPSIPPAVLLLSMLASSSARATEWDLGVALGAHLFAGDGRLARGDSPAANAPQHLAGAGLLVAVTPIPRLSVEVDAQFVPSLSRGGDHHVLPIVAWGAALRLNLATSAVRPFLVAGVGARSALAGAVSDGTVPHGVAGAGFQIDVARLLAVRVDARALLGPGVSPSLIAADVQALVTLVIHLDRIAVRPPPPAPAPTP